MLEKKSRNYKSYNKLVEIIKQKKSDSQNSANKLSEVEFSNIDQS